MDLVHQDHKTPKQNKTKNKVQTFACPLKLLQKEVYGACNTKWAPRESRQDAKVKFLYVISNQISAHLNQTTFKAFNHK